MNMDINLERHPEFLAASRKLADAQLELERIEQRIAEIHTEIATKQSPTLNDRAAAWLSGADAHAGVQKAGIREELGRLIDQKAVLSRAVTLQREVVDRIRHRVSERIAEEVRPAHVAIVSRIAKLVAELGKANQEEMAFRDALNERGVRFGAWIRPLAFFPAGSAGEEYSAANLFLKEVSEFCPEALARSSKPEKAMKGE